MSNTKFKKATKENLMLRMAISGPSGAGKTWTSMKLGTCLLELDPKIKGKRLAVIDTERGSASHYSKWNEKGEELEEGFDFDCLELDNFSLNSYIEAIQDASDSGEYGVIVIDSLSHAWLWELDQVNMSKNSYTAWGKLRPLERKLIDTMLSSPCHIIVTMRAKTEYVLEGKTPKKIGTAVIQASGIEFEFDIAGEMQLENNTMEITKSRAPGLLGSYHVMPGKKLAEIILEWLKGGVIDPEQKLKEDLIARILPYYGKLGKEPDLDSLQSMTIDQLKQEGLGLKQELESLQA